MGIVAAGDAAAIPPTQAAINGSIVKHRVLVGVGLDPAIAVAVVVIALHPTTLWCDAYLCGTCTDCFFGSCMMFSYLWSNMALAVSFLVLPVRCGHSRSSTR